MGSTGAAAGGATKHVRQKEIDLPDEVCRSKVIISPDESRGYTGFSIVPPPE